MFKHTIVRKPCRAMVDGITSAPELGKPDYDLACKQHDNYIEALNCRHDFGNGNCLRRSCPGDCRHLYLLI